MDVEILKDERIHESRVMRATVRLAAADKKAQVSEALQGLGEGARINPDETEDMRAALEERFGADTVATGVTALVAASAAASVVNQRNLKIMFSPEPVKKQLDEDELYGDDDLEMQIDIVIRPEFELTDYSPIVVGPIPKREVTEGMIDVVISQNVDGLARMMHDESPLKSGDYAVFDLKTNMNGLEAPWLSGEDMHLALMPGLMPDGFIDATTGMLIGEERDFTFAAVDHEAGKDAPPNVFEVHAKLTDKNTRVVPELTDALVREHFAGMGATVAEYREAVRTQLEERAVERQMRERETRVDIELAKRLDGEIDDLYFEHARDDILSNLASQLAAQGVSLAQYAEEQGVPESQIRLSADVQARESLQQAFALDAWWRHMGVKLTDADLWRAIHEMSPGREDEARENFDRSGSWFLVREVAARIRAHDDAVATAIYE